MQKPITNANKYHYKKWALEVAGVKKADVKPLWNGENTVKVIIVDQNSQPADNELVKKVQNYIDPYEEGTMKGWGCGNGQAPIGAYCTVASASSLDLTINAELKIKAGETLPVIKERVETALNNFLSNLIFNDDIDYISYAKVGAVILDVEGISDYKNLTINGETDNIIVPDTDTDRSIPILKTLELTQID